jgi:hypothetical protein
VQNLKDKAGKTSGQKPITGAWLSDSIDMVRDKNTVVLNDHGLEMDHLNPAQPGTYFGGSSAIYKTILGMKKPTKGMTDVTGILLVQLIESANGDCRMKHDLTFLACLLQI